MDTSSIASLRTGPTPHGHPAPPATARAAGSTIVTLGKQRLSGSAPWKSGPSTGLLAAPTHRRAFLLAELSPCSSPPSRPSRLASFLPAVLQSVLEQPRLTEAFLTP